MGYTGAGKNFKIFITHKRHVKTHEINSAYHTDFLNYLQLWNFIKTQNQTLSIPSASTIERPWIVWGGAYFPKYINTWRIDVQGPTERYLKNGRACIKAQSRTINTQLLQHNWLTWTCTTPETRDRIEPYQIYASDVRRKRVYTVIIQKFWQEVEQCLQKYFTDSNTLSPTVVYIKFISSTPLAGYEKQMKQ